MPRHSIVRSDRIEYSGGWLTLDVKGGMKLSRTQPRLAPGERAMSLNVVVPTALFRIPQLTATINIPADTAPPKINAETVHAVEDAIKAGIGMAVTVTVGNGEQP